MPSDTLNATATTATPFEEAPRLMAALSQPAESEHTAQQQQQE
jgi:hypothetical protein